MYAYEDILYHQKRLTPLIEPFAIERLQPASYDLSLGNLFVRYHDDGSVIRDNIPETTMPFQAEEYILEPGGFILGTTIERLTIPDNLTARFEGKSSLGRVGLVTHVTAGFIDPGFHGEITVELHNVNHRPIQLWHGMRIGQVCFFPLIESTAYPYDQKRNHFQNQVGPVVPERLR